MTGKHFVTGKQFPSHDIVTRKLFPSHDIGGGSDVAIAGDLKVSSPEYKNGVNTKYNQTGQQELKHKFANASEAFRESFQAGDQLAKESNRLRELDF